MTDQNEAKLRLMQCSCIIASGIVQGVIVANGGKSPKSQQPVTLDLHDQGTQEVVLAAYEIAKSEHAGLVRAFQDHSGVWSDVAIANVAASNPEAALSGVLGLAGVPAPVGALISQALALLKSPTAAAPVPAPGSDVPTPAGTAK